MKKKVPFMPVLGALSGVFSVATGFIFAKQASGFEITAQTLDAQQYPDYFSYIFGGQSTSQTDTGTVLLGKLCGITGKGFGLLLIFLGLAVTFVFASKIEKALRCPHCPPHPAEGFVPPAPAQGFASPVPGVPGVNPDFAPYPPQPPFGTEAPFAQPPVPADAQPAPAPEMPSMAPDFANPVQEKIVYRQAPMANNSSEEKVEQNS